MNQQHAQQQRENEEIPRPSERGEGWRHKLRIISRNIGKGLRLNVGTLLLEAKRVQADIILVQDTGETTRTAFMQTVEAAQRQGFSYFAKNIIPDDILRPN
jgi:hypothetical protein